MQSLINRIAGLFKWMDSIEFAIPATLAMVLILAGPPLAAAYLLHIGNYSAAAISGGLWLLAALALIRDLGRRRLTWVGGSFICVWLIATIAVWCKMAAS